MPKVSVIIPVYNAEEYLYDCLDSIINQTLKDIEIICVNDGSSDKSLEILNEYASNDGRFIILTQDNQGAGVARNKGLDNANGEFVSFIDPDDFYPNYNTLEILYNTANEKKVLACAGSLMELRDGKYCIPRREGFCFPQNGMVDFIDYQFIYGYTRYIFNLDFLKSNKLYFPPYRRFQDPVFLLKTLHKMKRFYTIKDYTYVYRIQEHDGEYYSDRIMTDLAKGMKDVITYAKENNLRKVTMRMRNKIFIKFYLDMFENFKVDGVDCLYYLFEPRSFTDEQIENISEKFENKSIMSKFKSREYIQYFFKNGGRIDEYEEDMDKPDFITMWGNALWNPQPETLKYALENDIPVIKAEDGFLRSADTWCNTITDKKYTNCIAFTFTNDVLYFDATRSSYTERQINDTKFKLTEEQLQRTKKAINFIIKNHLTKYNHQPIYTPQIGRKGVPKILVVDQSYGDYSP